MPEREAKPEPSAVTARVAHLRKVWSQAHANWEVIDTYINRTFPVWDAPYTRRPSYHPARSSAILDHAVDNQLAFEPSVTRPSHSESPLSMSRADKIEPFIVAVFAESSLQEPTLTWKQAGRHLLGYGYTVVEGPMVFMQDRPEPPIRIRSEDEKTFSARQVLYENERRTWMPFRIRAPHPSRVPLDPMEKNPHVGIVHAWRYKGDVEREVNKRKERSLKRNSDVTVVDYSAGADPWTQVLINEWFSKDWHGMFIADGGLLFLEPNRSGFTPFHHAFSGFGQEPTQMQGGIDPSDLAVGILNPLLESLRVHAQASSSIHNALVEAAFRNRMTKNDANLISAQEARGATIVEVPGGKESMWWEDTAQLPEWIFKAIAATDQDIELGSFSKSLAGIRETGVTTVGQQAILSTAAGRKFVAPGKQLEHLATNVASNILRLVDIMGEKLTVRGHELSPNDIEHDYSLDVKFELIDPVLQMQERITALNEYDHRLLSDLDYWSRTRTEDATGLRERIDEEDARNLPGVKILRMQMILEKWGLLQEMEKRNIGLDGSVDGAPPGGTPENPQGLTPNTPGRSRTGGALGNVSSTDLDRAL